MKLKEAYKKSGMFFVDWIEKFKDYELTPPQPKQSPGQRWIPIDINQILTGDVLREYAHGKCISMRAVEDAKLHDGGWRCQCINAETGARIELFHNMKADPNKVYCPDIYRLKQPEQPKKEYKAREWAGPMYESLPEDAKLEPKQPKPEPEAWGELRAYLGKPPWGHCEPVKSAEAAWPEIERRVRRMIRAAQGDSRQNEQQFIDHAIKAYNERLVRELMEVADDHRKDAPITDREIYALADKLEGES